MYNRLYKSRRPNRPPGTRSVKLVGRSRMYPETAPYPVARADNYRPVGAVSVMVYCNSARSAADVVLAL